MSLGEHLFGLPTVDMSAVVYSQSNRCRLLKIGKYSEGLQLLGNTMRRSARNLLLLCFFLSIAVIILSFAVYYAERGVWCDEENRFCYGTGESPLRLPREEIVYAMP